MNSGTETATKSLTRIARSSDHRSPVQPATSRTFANSPFRLWAANQRSSNCCSVDACISTGGALTFGAWVAITGFAAVIRSRTTPGEER